MVNPNNNFWFEPELAKLRDLWMHPELTTADIAARMPGRSVQAIRNKSKEIGLPAKPRPPSISKKSNSPNLGKRQVRGKNTLPPLASLQDFPLAGDNESI